MNRRTSQIFYRPQTKFAKVAFLHVSVILSTGESASVHAAIPLGADTPPVAEPPPPRSSASGRYDQQAGGTHPTGMHSCLINIQFLQTHGEIYL